MPHNELLDIFSTDESKTTHDILAMPDLFARLYANTEIMKQELFSGDAPSISDFLIPAGMAASLHNIWHAISDKETYIAVLPPNIREGIENGTYHFPPSHTNPGNHAPLIFDADNNLVGQVTLKKASDPSRTLSNFSTLAIQAALQEISSELRSIHENLKYLISITRNELFGNKYFNARDKIMQAADASQKEQEKLLAEADTYLMEGWNSLHSDIIIHINKLAGFYSGIFSGLNRFFTSNTAINSTLSYIREDMLMIQQFVALRAYLFNYLGNGKQTIRVISEYSTFLQQLNNSIYYGNRYTAWELIHANSPSNPKFPDFWIEKPKQLIRAIDSSQGLLQRTDSQVFILEFKK